MNYLLVNLFKSLSLLRVTVKTVLLLDYSIERAHKLTVTQNMCSPELILTQVQRPSHPFEVAGHRLSTRRQGPNTVLEVVSLWYRQGILPSSGLPL